MNYHSVAELFPLIEGEDFERLVADIDTNGQREAIVVLPTGEILDGRNRYRACDRLRLKPITRVYAGDTPIAYVISLNLHRRHLNESQRAMVASKLANLGEGRPKETASIEAVSQDRSAELLNVSRSAVQRATKVRSEGTPELVSAVEQGRIAVSQAANIAAMKPDKQREAVKEIEGGKSAASVIQKSNREEKLVTIAAENDALPTKRYSVIYADPPWQYEHVETESRAIENQYPTMTLDAICALPIAEIAAENCVLFLWATSPKLAETVQVIDRWGFVYRTCAVWDKQQIGMGYYFRQQHELLLVATRGDIPAPAVEARESSVYRETRGPHSAKPEHYAALIECMYPGLQCIELFNRGGRAGWDTWGNQSHAA